MRGKKQILMVSGLVLAVSLLVSSLTVVLVSRSWRRISYELLNSVCTRILVREPEAIDMIAAGLKEAVDEGRGYEADRDVLRDFGYDKSDVASLPAYQSFLCAAAGFFAGLLILAVTVWYRDRQESRRIQALTEYLEQVNLGRAGIMGTFEEDPFSGLEDEIYKTVTSLYETRDQAVETRNNFAHNLSNIAHQIKTPITAISLSLQTMKRAYDRKHLEQIEKQLGRLTRLEEALLVLARLDAGVLVLEKEKVDVFTLLVLAADNLEELLRQSGTAIEIPELGEFTVTADLEWTMEAVMNLMKNSMEHNEGGRIYCDYGQNPLYTLIRIRDEGEGFAKEDIPHLFQRFYRGKKPKGSGIGIGLALAKEIIERQNGVIRAGNMPEGGAYFEIRFYGGIADKEEEKNGNIKV